jgi:hypothetical protein
MIQRCAQSVLCLALRAGASVLCMLAASIHRRLAARCSAQRLRACRGKKAAAPLSDDNLVAHNHLQAAGKAQAAQAANDMVFIAPMGPADVQAELDDVSHVDTNLPFVLEKMPKMPKGSSKQ